MRFFDVLDFQYLILTVFLGLASPSHIWASQPRFLEGEAQVGRGRA
jgi:hypothetical protein